MLHARKDGESFGIAIAEFASHGKPVITWKHNEGDHCGMKIDVEHKFHHEILGDKGIYYANGSELFNILINFKDYKHIICDGYSKFSPKNVMQLFKKYIIDDQTSPSIELAQSREQLKDHSEYSLLLENSNAIYVGNASIEHINELGKMIPSKNTMFVIKDSAFSLSDDIVKKESFANTKLIRMRMMI